MRKWMLSGACVLAVSRLGAVGSGGYTNQVVGAKALSLGNAFTAVADDPSALFFNPAGLAGLEGTQVSLGVGPTLSNTTYYPAGGGADENTENDVAWVPNIYATRRLTETLGLGFGVFSPFGLETHWSNTGSLKYIATDSRLRVVELSAGLGYQPNHLIAIGAGAVYARVDARLQAQLNLTALNSFLNGVPSPSADGVKTLEGDGGAFGYTAGVMLNPRGSYRLGLSYRSSVHSDVEGESTFSDLNGTAATVFGGTKYTTSTKTRVILPDSLTLGGAANVGERWLLTGDVEWVGYGRIDKTHFTFDETNALRSGILNAGNPVPRDWNSTWNVGVGAGYKLNDHFEPRAGYFYYPEAIPEYTWEPSTPESERHGLTVGLGYSEGAFKLDVVYNVILTLDRTINNTVGASSDSTVNGEYSSIGHVVGINLTMRWK